MKRLIVVLLAFGTSIGTSVPSVMGAESGTEHEYRVLWAAEGSRGSGDLVEVAANFARINAPGDESAQGIWSGYGIVSVQIDQCRSTTLDITDLQFSEGDTGASVRWDSGCGLVDIEWRTDPLATPDPGDYPSPNSTLACAGDGEPEDQHISQGNSTLAVSTGSIDDVPFGSEQAFISFGKWRSAGCE